MPKVNKLKDIDITHISLVKEGANGKEFIYKSADDEGGYENVIDIKKTDEEQGIIYGIVYAPGEVDSQGDFADADEILKAAYGFMKSLNARNVDVDHSFNNEDAFVAESWIVKGGDPVFGDEPEGSWAVAIKLESEELKGLAKSGDIAGLSMAGKANKTVVEKEGKSGDDAFKKFFEAFAEVATDMWVDFGAFIKKSKGENMEKKMENFGAVVKKKLEDATKEAGEQLATLIKEKEVQGEKITALEKSIGDTSEKITALEKSNKELAAANDELKEANEKLTGSNEKLIEDAKTQSEEIEKLKSAAAEVTETLKKSKQPAPATAPKNDEKKGTL